MDGNGECWKERTAPDPGWMKKIGVTVYRTKRVLSGDLRHAARPERIKGLVSKIFSKVHFLPKSPEQAFLFHHQGNAGRGNKTPGKWRREGQTIEFKANEKHREKWKPGAFRYGSIYIQGRKL